MLWSTDLVLRSIERSTNSLLRLLLQMSEGKKTEVILLDERRLEILTQVRTSTSALFIHQL